MAGERTEEDNIPALVQQDGPMRTGREATVKLLSDISYKYALVLVWLGAAILFSVLRPDTFASIATVQTVFSSQSVLVVLTLGLLWPLIVGEFDLSVGANLGLALILTTVLNVKFGWPVAIAVAVSLVAGLLIGAVNGALVVLLGVNALVSTLGIGTLLVGVGYFVSGYVVLTGVDHRLVVVMTDRVLGLPLDFYYAVLLGVVIWYVVRYTPLGRHLIFVGANRDVARLSGLRVDAIRMGAFVACGFMSALAGVVLAGTIGGEDPNAGNGYLLPAYAAAFLGATTITPGQFNPIGALVAVYFLLTGITGLQLMGLTDWVQDVFYGATLVVAVTLSHLAARRRAFQ
jgi:ribose transport system permease protein